MQANLLTLTHVYSRLLELIVVVFEQLLGPRGFPDRGFGWRALGRQKLDDHAAVKTRSREEGTQDYKEATNKVSQEIIRPCRRRISALLQKQLLFSPRCVMSAHPQQPVA